MRVRTAWCAAVLVALTATPLRGQSGDTAAIRLKGGERWKTDFSC